MWTRVLTLGLVFCALNINAQRLINVDFGAHTNPAFTTKTGQAATGLSNADFWNLYSRDGANGETLSSSQLLNLKLSTGAATDADLFVSGAPGAWYVPNPDAMFQSYLYPGDPNIQITFSNVPPATYDIYVYAHGEPASENSVIEVSSGGAPFGQKSTSSAANWDQPGWVEDNEYVVFRDVEIGAAPLFILVRPGVASMSVINGIQLLEKIPSAEITISQQPKSAYATIGGTANFAVTTSSPLPLSYQWFFQNGTLTNETNSVLHLGNVSEAKTGSYFVTVSNSGSSVQSTNAFLLLYSAVTNPLLNIDFGAHLNPFLFEKTGPAVVGKSLTDKWNFYSRDGEDGSWLDNNSLTNLVWSDGAASEARIDVSNAAGAWAVLHPDEMFHSYLYPISRAGNISAVLSGLPSGTYDVYVYAHGAPAPENAAVQITTPSTDFGIKVTSSDVNWNDSSWSEGDHYVLFTDVHIRSGETLNLSSKPGQSGLAVLNGLQLLQKSMNPPATISITTQPRDQIVPTGGTAEFSVAVTNDPPLAYQWFFNNNPLPTTTNPVLRIENVSSANVGAYSVQVSTGTASATSAQARLQVFTPVAGPLLNIDYGAHLNPYLPTNIGPAAVGIALDDRWNLYSRDGLNGVWLANNSLRNLVWSDGTPSAASINVTNASGAWYTWNPNPMFKSYLYPGVRRGNIGSVISNLPAGTFDVYVYAHGEIPGENGVVEVSTPSSNYGVKTTSSAPGWDTASWTEGNHYVLFKNVILNGSEPLRIVAKPGVNGLAVINGVQFVKNVAIPGSEIVVQNQPEDVVLPAGTSAELSITASSGLPLEYQWYRSGVPIQGATSPTLTFGSLLPSDAGRYRVVVRNFETSVTSRTAALEVYTRIEAPLLNIDFGSHQNPVFTTNVGPSAFGRNLDDRWNLYSRDDGNFGWRSDGVLTDLVWSDGTNSNIQIEVSNGAGAWYTDPLDPMFQSYLYPLSREGNISANVANLPAGKYDLVVYAHGAIPGENGVISLATDSADYGTQTNSAAADWNPGYWTNGSQYIVFTNVTVAAGETLEITSGPGVSGLSVINGVQLIQNEGTRPDQPFSPIVADWDFENGAPGNRFTFVPDVSGQGHNITQVLGNPTAVATDSQIVGAVSAMFPPGGAAFGSALRAPDSTKFNLGARFTIEVGVSPGAQNDTWDRGVVVGQDAASGKLAFALDYRSEDRSISFVIVDAHGGGDNVDALIPNDGIAHHVAGVYDSGTIKIYLDKALIATKVTSLVPGISGAGRVTLGANDIGGYWFNGTLDRVRISQAALAPEEFFPHHREVNSGVAILQPLQNVTVASGGTATFQVSAIGHGPLSYAWFHNGTQLAGESTNKLIISNVQQTNAGTYKVTVTSGASEASSSATLAILSVDRTIALGDTDPVQEGARVEFPVLVTSSGDIGALSFVINYDTNYLAEPELDWKNQQHGAFTQVNTDTAGSIHATYVLPGKTFRAGEEEELATITFRTRSVPESLTTPVTLVLNGVYSDAGDPITSGTAVESTEIRITRREYIGDNNANDRLDVGDATAIIRMLTALDPIRVWDVTGNDLNVNSSLDAGDIVRVLRAVVNRDPQPGENHGRLAALAVQSLTPGASLAADRTRLVAGQQVRVQVNFALPGVSLSGASFRLDYPPSALRLESSSAHIAGPRVPQNAVAMWNLAPSQDYAAQNGTIHYGASTATAWAANSGSVAELTFTVLNGAATKYAWPIRLVSGEAGSGIDVIPLAPAQLVLTGRDAQSAEFNTAALNVTSGAFELRLTGEPDVRYQIESSTNLVDWQNLGIFSNATGAILVNDAVTAGGHKFYRAIQLD
ncbi:MAG TPA: immunoglobulin domain-containing protein [Verrucomicrobiae bacterium]